MSAEVVYADRAREDLKKLDRQIAQRIVKKIRYFAEQSDPLQFAKRLQPPLQDRWRFRIGDYRAIFSIGKDGNIKLLTILRVKHRREAYS